MGVFISGILLIHIAVFVTLTQSNDYCENICHITSNNNCSSPTLPGCYILPLKKISEKKTECEALNFHQASADSNRSTFKLRAYIDEKCGTIRITAFNLTFSSIKWRYLQYRFKRIDHLTSSFCEEIHLLSALQVLHTTELHRDCRWSTTQYEGADYYFQYHAGQNSSPEEGRKYVLTVPPSASIDYKRTPFKDLKVFMYVDITALPHAILIWQQVPKHLNVKKYLVKCFLNDIALLPEAEVLANPDQDELSLGFDHVSSGTFQCMVQIGDEQCGKQGCAVSKSPKIPIGGVPTSYFIAIICMLILLPFLLFGCYQLAKYHFTFGTPVVLIIYKQTVEPHCRAVLALAQHLRYSCKIEALVDQIDIPCTDAKNPFIWCQDAFASANHVMVLSSPLQDFRTGQGIYRNIDDVGLRLLGDHFTDSHFERKFFSVILPYCNEADIPPDAKALKCFKLTEDWDEMLRHIYIGSAQSLFSKLFFFCFKPKMNGSKSELKKYGIKLLTAFDEATEEIEKIRGTSQDASMSLTFKMDLIDPSCAPVTQLLSSIPMKECVQQDKLFCGYTGPAGRCDSTLQESLLTFPGDIEQLNLSGRRERMDTTCNVNASTRQENGVKEDLECYFDLYSVLR